MNALSGLLCGALFGYGLALSGMTDTNRVLGFLDLFGAWQPALLFVMGSAVLVTIIGFRFLKHRSHPLLAAVFNYPLETPIDRRLLTGSALFGIGWGLYGYCPGPALSSAIYGNGDTYLFIAAMLVGMLIASRIPERAA